MSWWGKIVGSGIGLLGGPIGGLIGGSIGHWFDERNTSTTTDERRALLHYYAYFFSCAAKIAKADGGISSKEIGVIESLIHRLRLSGPTKDFAKDVFRKSKKSSTPISTDFKNCHYLTKGNPTMSLSFMGGLYEIACAENGKPSEIQLRCLLLGESHLKLPHGTIRSWIEGEYVPDPKMYRRKNEQSDLKWAYRVLGVEENTSEMEIKSQYRKKMGVLHPDKLSGKDLPDELLVFTTEQAALINEAYDKIRKDKAFS